MWPEQDGDDSNPGTGDLPLASVYRALVLIKAAYASEPFDTAVITVDGTVINYGAEAGLFGMVTIRGENVFPSIILRGSGDASVLDAGGMARVLYMDSGNMVTLENITLLGGKASTGAGVYVEDGILIAGEGSVIKGNDGGYGGGICVEGGTLVVRGTVTGNSAENGGGIAMRGKTSLDLSGPLQRFGGTVPQYGEQPYYHEGFAPDKYQLPLSRNDNSAAVNSVSIAAAFCRISLMPRGDWRLKIFSGWEITYAAAICGTVSPFFAASSSARDSFDKLTGWKYALKAARSRMVWASSALVSGLILPEKKPRARDEYAKIPTSGWARYQSRASFCDSPPMPTLSSPQGFST